MQNGLLSDTSKTDTRVRFVLFYRLIPIRFGTSADRASDVYDQLTGKILNSRALSFFAGAFFAIALPCSAQQSPALDRFSVSAGVFNSKPKVEATVGNSLASVSSGEVDGERKTMPRVSAELLLGDHHGILFDAFRFNRGYANSVAGTYSAGPLAVNASAGLNLGFNLDVAQLGYRYWLGSGDTVVGLGAGIGYYRVSLHTDAVGSVNAGLGGIGFVNNNGQYSRVDSDDAVAPMLEFGVRHAFSPNFRAFFDGSGIYRSGGSGVHGSIYNASAGVEWFPVHTIGVSLAYAVSDVDLKRDDSGLQRLRVKFQGPVASLKMRF